MSVENSYNKVIKPSKIDYRKKGDVLKSTPFNLDIA